MGQVSITVSGSITLDGISHSNSGTVTLQCKAFTQQTRDFVDSFDLISDSNLYGNYVIVTNLGTESLFVQFADVTPNYLVLEVVAGAHGVFPTSLNDGAVFEPITVSIRSETAAGCRGLIMMAKTT